MDKFKQLNKIQEIFANGGNIIQFLKNLRGDNKNNLEDIMISYDFQSGSYLKGFSENRDFKEKYCKALAEVINCLEDIDSIIEVGVGEGTTLSGTILNLNKKPNNIFGFDISWSRLKFARGFLKDFNLLDIKLFTSNLFEIPLPDNSIDCVYTSHSIEPNGGSEELALKELFRVTKKYLVLLEPAYELACTEAKERMRKHGYVTKLYSTAKELNYNILEYRLFDFSLNPLNPTGIMIIKKDISFQNSPELLCPISHTELIRYDDGLLYSKDSSLAYPIINDIPCLLKENAILASHLLTDYEKFKSENEIIF